MKNYIIIIISVSLIKLSVFANDQAHFQQDKIYEYEEFWPIHVKVLEDSDTVKGKISKGSRGVLIRLEGEMAILDLGRQGIVRIPYKYTDIVALTELNYYGKGDKTYPLMTGLIGNKLIYMGSGGEFRNLSPKEIENLRYYLLLLLPRQSDDVSKIIELLKNKYNSWQKQHLEIVHFSQEATPVQQLDYFKDFSIPWKSLLYNMLSPYQEVFALDYGQDPAIYLLSRNGSIIYKERLKDNIEVIIEKIEEKIYEKTISR